MRAFTEPLQELEEFQKIKYTDSEGISKIKAKAQEELTKMDFENIVKAKPAL